MPKRKSVSERLLEDKCGKCGAYLMELLAANPQITHRSIDQVEEFHNHNHGENTIGGSSKKVKRSKAATEAVSAPPETHRYQSIFLEVVWNKMPKTNKLNPEQPVFVSEDVTLKVLNGLTAAKVAFDEIVEEKYGEEQIRPVMSALITGLIAINYGGEEALLAKQSPVRYFMKVQDKHGNISYVQVSPPGEKAKWLPERSGASLCHDDKQGKRWKQDITLWSHVKVADESDKEVKAWIPRILIEAKGDEASKDDLYRASTSGWKYQLRSLQEKVPIGRLYLEVWGIQLCFYGIQDIFGYVTVENGVVTQESFDNYLRMVKKQKRQWGEKGFYEESFQRTPTTLADLQAQYDIVAAEYKEKYHVDLPSKGGIEEFPVGVVYLDTTAEIIPSATAAGSMESACRFVQGHARILTSDWIIPSDLSDVVQCRSANNRLLRNHDKFFAEAKIRTIRRYKKGPMTPFPERRVFKNLAEAGVTDPTLLQTLAEAGAIDM